MDYVDSESIYYLSVDIVAICSRNQHFALVVVYEDSAYHDEEKRWNFCPIFSHT